MKKSDFMKFVATGSMQPKKNENPIMKSVTDPTYAQSGRDLVFNPLNYEAKPIYSNGVPLKDMQPFDGMYKDKHDAFQAAKELNTREQENARKWRKKQDNPEPQKLSNHETTN